MLPRNPVTTLVQPFVGNLLAFTEVRSLSAETLFRVYLGQAVNLSLLPGASSRLLPTAECPTEEAGFVAQEMATGMVLSPPPTVLALSR